MGLIGADQQPGALLAHIELAVEVDAVQHLVAGLLVEGDDLGDLLGDEILMRHGEDGQFEADETADLARPQAAGIDDMLGMYRALAR